MSSRLSRDRGTPGLSSIFDAHASISVAPSWRCPHCATLQQESSRCWACSRSAIECGSCRLYRTSIAVGLGYCGLDRQKTLLDSGEVRPCWQSDAAAPGDPGLFDDLESEPSPNHEVAPTRQRLPARPAPSTDPLAGSGLIEAPHVAPARQLGSAVQRRHQGDRG